MNIARKSNGQWYLMHNEHDHAEMPVVFECPDLGRTQIWKPVCAKTRKALEPMVMQYIDRLNDALRRSIRGRWVSCRDRVPYTEHARPWTGLCVLQDDKGQYIEVLARRHYDDGSERFVGIAHTHVTHWWDGDLPPLPEPVERAA